MFFLYSTKRLFEWALDHFRHNFFVTVWNWIIDKKRRFRSIKNNSFTPSELTTRSGSWKNYLKPQHKQKRINLYIYLVGTCWASQSLWHSGSGQTGQLPGPGRACRSSGRTGPPSWALWASCSAFRPTQTPSFYSNIPVPRSEIYCHFIAIYRYLGLKYIVEVFKVLQNCFKDCYITMWGFIAKVTRKCMIWHDKN